MATSLSLRSRLATLVPDLAMPARADWIFALRTVAAGLVALMIAWALHLEQPQWAMMTVFIVSQPVAGMVLAKGLFRLAGTLIGAFAAVLMVKLTGDMHILFVVVLALWIAVCTYIASLLRNPESYGAVLAGYTVAIIGLPAFDNGALVTELASARCIEIMLGIACAGIASRLFLPQLARDVMVERVSSGLKEILRYGSGALAGVGAGELDTLYKRLIVDIEALAAMRAYARIEAPGLVTHGRMMRHTIGHMLSAISSIHTLLAHASARDSIWWPLLNRIRATLDAMGQRAWETEDVRPWLRQIEAYMREAAVLRDSPMPPEEDRVGTVARITVLAEFLTAIRLVLDGLAALRLRAPDPGRNTRLPSLLIDRDRSAAFVNAVRAAAATAVVTAYWIGTRWADVGGVAVMVAVVSSLFATMPNPMRSAMDFFKGTLIAVIPAFLVGQILLPLLPGLVWVMVIVTPFLIPAGLAMANPRFSSMATAFAINFLLFLNLRAVMISTPLIFLNEVLAVLGGILLSVAVFAVVLPRRPEKVIERVVDIFRADLTRLCLHDRLPKASAFESLAYDRINQLMAPLERVGVAGNYVLDGSLAAVTMGLEIIRLRNLLAQGSLHEEPARDIASILTPLANVLVTRVPHAKQLRDMIDTLRTLSAGMVTSNSNTNDLQAAASLRVIAAALDDHPKFF